jgi:hypothetical protein
MKGKQEAQEMGGEGSHPIHINVSVEPINPCVTNTPKKTSPFRQPKFRGILTTRSTSIIGETTGGASSSSISQVSTPHDGGSSSVFRKVGHNPIIGLVEFRGEATKDPEKHLLICEKIWEKNKSLMKTPNSCS